MGLLLLSSLVLGPTFSLRSMDNMEMEMEKTCLNEKMKCDSNAQCCSGFSCLPSRGFSFTCQEEGTDLEDKIDGDDDNVEVDDEANKKSVGPEKHCQGVWGECLGDRECCNDLKCVDF